jgi:hypothetical protein
VHCGGTAEPNKNGCEEEVQNSNLKIQILLRTVCLQPPADRLDIIMTMAAVYCTGIHSHSIRAILNLQHQSVVITRSLCEGKEQLLVDSPFRERHLQSHH